MWQHWALVALVLSVPVQYLMSKYWSPSGAAEPGPSHSRSSYFLQRTFASLDEKLRLEEWSRWPHELVQCAKRFVFDYINSVAQSDRDDGKGEMEKAVPEPEVKPVHNVVNKPKPPKFPKNAKFVAKKHGEDEPDISEMSEEPNEPFDENVHFGGSREPRMPRHPEVIYRVGQVFRHLKHKYRGVIVGWDVRPKVPSQVARVIFGRDKQELKNQPFYASLIDTRDRVTPQLDYVAQEYIQPVYNTVIVHPILHEYFESSRPDQKTGRYLMRPRLRVVYPDD